MSRSIDTDRWRKLEPLLDAALDRPPDERADFLRRSCGGDETVYREVEGMLADAERTHAVLDSTALDRFAPLVEERPGAEPELPPLLADRYRVVRQLGRGGMATVHLAVDEKHGRQVAVKVLGSELSAAVARERFLSEIEIAARLTHPYIVPLHDSGGTGELLFYVMPFVDGESLRARLRRERRLPTADALRIAAEVAEALSHAHARNVVHRDIKPENILFAEGHAMVCDFGIAQAVQGSVAPRRTGAGMVLGTPAYTSPEQASGERPVSQASDIYSLGCVLYEMLAGAPPFGRAPVHEVLAAQVHDPAPPLAGVPPALAALVSRCLEKDPARRPASAGELLRSLRELAGPPPRPSLASRRPGLLLLASLLLVAATASGWRLVAGRAPPLDPDVIAVLPFRVASADPSLASLREGMIDLLETKFVGAARVVDARSLLSAWRRAGGSDSTDLDERAALAIARRLTASQLLLGRVSGDAHTVALAATLRDVRGGATREAAVEGPHDSLPVLIDRLVGQLLALHTGQDARSVVSLVNVPMPVLREYITAQALGRRGRFEDAVEHYRAAIAGDSSFALAGIGLALNVGWLDAGDWNEGWRVAWRGRARLGPADRAILESWVGRGYPEWPARSELRRLAEHAVRVAPHRAEAWYALGDHLYHYGALQGIEHAAEQSLAALDRAIALDSMYGHAAEHLPDLYLRLGDTASARRAAELVLALDSTSRYGAFSLWYAGAALGDSSRRARALQALERSASSSVAGDIAESAVATGIGHDDAQQLLERLTSTAPTEAERAAARYWLYQLASARGRPTDAARLVDGIVPLPQFVMFTRLFENGDSASAARFRGQTAGELEPGHVMSHCTTAELDAVYDLLERGDAGEAALQSRDVEMRLTSIRGGWLAECTIAAMTLDVQLAERRRAPELLRLTLRLDSALRTAPPAPLLTLAIGNIVVMRAFEQLGDPHRALNAARRRPILYGPLLGWAPMLREEARLAALVGDRDGATRAYRVFIALRDRAEPRLQGEVARARAELAALERPAGARPE